MKKKTLLIINAVILTLSACSSINNMRQPAQPEAPTNAAIATETLMPTPTTLPPTAEEAEPPIPTSILPTTESNESVIATSVAATVEASNTLTASAAPTDSATEEIQPTETSTSDAASTATTAPAATSSTAPSTPTLTATANPTSSSPAPTISVSVGTNCRTGPGKGYDYIGELREGESAEVIGKKPSYNYWIIKNPDADGECWLWGEYATVTGDTSTLKEYAVPTLPPSTASPTPPSTADVTARVSVETNCRSGPGKVYDQISVLKVGQSAEVVGKKEFYNYWIIQNPAGEGTCWLWGKYATITGNTSKLDEYTIPALPATPNPSAPAVSVSVGTNCRTGPGKSYKIIGGLRVGESAEVIGKNPLLNYWIINNPDAAGNCWLWGYYATVTGNTSDLPEYTVEMTP